MLVLFAVVEVIQSRSEVEKLKEAYAFYGKEQAGHAPGLGNKSPELIADRNADLYDISLDCVHSLDNASAVARGEKREAASRNKVR